MRAHAERFDIDDRPSFERRFALVRTRQCDARLDAFFERGGTRRVITAERHTPDADTLRIDVGAPLEIIDHRADRFFILGADRKVVLGFTLTGTVECERRKAAL